MRTREGNRHGSDFHKSPEHVHFRERPDPRCAFAPIDPETCAEMDPLSAVRNHRLAADSSVFAENRAESDPVRGADPKQHRGHVKKFLKLLEHQMILIFLGLKNHLNGMLVLLEKDLKNSRKKISRMFSLI